ncbi:hypothetical protein ACE6H2_011276 [Prunus campanulata]
MVVVENKCQDLTADNGWRKCIAYKHTNIKTKPMMPKPPQSLPMPLLPLLSPLPTQEGKVIEAHHVVIPIVHCNVCKDNDLFDKRKGLTDHFATAHVKTRKLCGEKVFCKEPIYPKHEPHVCIPSGAPCINKYDSGTSMTMRDASTLVSSHPRLRDLKPDNDLFDKIKGMTDHFVIAHVKTHNLCGEKVLCKDPIYSEHEPCVCIAYGASRIN